MRAAAPRPIVVADACVLIDFLGAAEELLVLGARRVWEVHVLTPIVAEIRSLEEGRCDELGLVAVEPEFDLLLEAQTRRRSLSFQDRLCLVYAKNLTPNGVVWTNDKKMRQEAEADGLQVYWGSRSAVGAGAARTRGAGRGARRSLSDPRQRAVQVEPIMAQFRAALAAL